MPSCNFYSKYFTTTFHGFWFEFSVHLCSRAQLFQKTCLFMFYILTAFKTNFHNNVFPKGKIIDYIEHLTAEHIF